MRKYQDHKNPYYQGYENLETMSLAVNYNKFLIEEIHRNAPKKGEKKIFDFGAGIGQFTKIWKGKNVNISAIEIDPKLSNILRNKGIQVTSLDRMAESVADYVYSINVLEHIEDDEEILSKLFSCLKKGGILFIYVPAFELLWTSMDNNVGHVRRYQKNEIENKLKKFGFEVKKSQYVDSTGFFATLFMKPFMNSDGILNERLVTIYDKYCFPLSRILDRLIFGSWFGKNIAIVAQKPSAH